MILLTATSPADTAAIAQALETIPKYRFLFWAYVLIFVVLFVFVLTIYLRQRSLNREIKALERRLGGAG